MEGLLNDLRYGIRSLRRAAGFSATCVLILALGIGAATAVFAAYRAIVLDALPVADPDRLVLATLHGPAGEVALVPAEIEALRRESRTLGDAAGAARFGAEAVPLTEGDRSLVLDMASVTANFFEVAGARPAFGRLLRAEDGDEGAAPVAVLSHHAWRRAFGGDPDVIGRRLTLTLYQESYEIVGVAPPGLDYPVGADYWIPARPRQAMDLIVRLAPGTSPDAARAEILAIAQALDGARSDPRGPAAVAVQPLAEAVNAEARPILRAVAAAVALLLLIACVNVGNLLLMRATQRTGEVAIRRALGATSGRVARSFLVEGALLGATGGALGLAVAAALLRILPGLAPDRLPRTEMIELAGAPVGIALGVTVAAILLFGLAPAVAAARGGDAGGIRIDARAGTGTRRRRTIRRTLVAAQVALAVVLLFGAGLLVRSFQRLAGLDLGYDTQRVAIVELGFSRAGEGPAEVFALLDAVMERMRELPGVTAASPIMIRPFRGGTGIFAARPMLEGQTDADAAGNPTLPLEVGGAELFRTLGIPIVGGRGLLDTDREGAPRVAVVSQSVADRLWPGEDPVGRRFHMVTADANWWTVVGVAGDTRYRHLREATPTVYLHFRQLPILPAVWTIAARTDADLAALLPAMRTAVHDLEPRLNVWRAATLDEHLARGPLARPRMTALLLSGFALAALLLAAIGLYGVMALAVRERTRELGVRRALGAPAPRLRRDVLGDALAVTLAGTVVGLGAALLLSRLLVALLFDVGPADPVTLAGVCAVLLLVAAVAAYLPARRAARVDPMHALRAD